MKEGTLAEFDLDRDEDVSQPAGLTSSKAFPALVALWFAALFGGGCLFLPPVLFDVIFGGNSPFGPQTRIIVALGAAGIGLLLGLFIASRVREDAPSTAAPPAPKPRKRGTRPPLDVRAALGLSDDDDDDDFDNEFGGDTDFTDIPDHEAFDLTDEVRPPIDDPYFASAWSDSDAYEVGEEVGEFDEPPAMPAPAPVEPAPQASHRADPAPDSHDLKPTRYNPFADFIASDEEEPAPPEPSAFEQPVPSWEPAPEPEARRAETRPTAPPPPPAWPQPRAEEPALTELGVAELVERLARALQGEERAHSQKDAAKPQQPPRFAAPPRSGTHRHESALAPSAARAPDIDRELRGALDRLSRFDDVA